MWIRIRFILLSFSLLQIWVCEAQGFKINVSDNTINQFGEVQAEYILNNVNTFSDFVPPRFSDWEVVQGPGFSEQTVTINNQLQKTVSYIYTLSPKKIGNLKVPSTTVILNGKQLTCDVATVHVTSKTSGVSSSIAKSQPLQIPALTEPSVANSIDEMEILKPNENADDKIKKNIFVKVTSSKSSCYVGEPVLVTYALYAALNTYPKVTRQPSFSGAGIIELTNLEEPITTQVINNKKYNVFIIRKVQLIPLQEGALKLDSASVQNEVSFGTLENPYRLTTYSLITTSNPLTIMVKSLPEKNKPADFFNAIGTFAISQKASEHIRAGENNNLQIIITGQGNFQNITMPAIQWPAGIQHFDETDSEHLNKHNFPVSGSVMFNIPFITIKEGAVAFPEIKFSFFDPSLQQYKTVQAPGFIIYVSPALPKVVIKDNIIISSSSHLYLWIIIAAIAVLALILLIAFHNVRNKRKFEQQPKIQQAKVQMHPVSLISRAYENDILMLKETLNNQQFFIKLKNLLTEVLQEKLQLSDDAESQLLMYLQVKIPDTEISEAAKNIYEQCNLSLYSPVMGENIKENLLAQFIKIYDALNAI